MGLRFDPVGGGQFKQAVAQIIEAERQPIKTLEARKAKEDARLKLFQDFKTKFAGLDKAIDELSNFKKFRELKADVGDGTNLVSVTLDKEKAEPGKYLLAVDELASRTSTISNGFENANDPVLGLGFVSMNLQGGGTKEIYIDDKDSSLNGIARIINNTADSPVRAAVIRDDANPESPWRLLLTGKKDGADNQIDFPEFYFMDSATDFYVDDDNEAQNASLEIDGFNIESESNDINDFLPGVNLHLKQAKPGSSFMLTISEDYQKISGKVKGLIDQINQVFQFITKQNAIDAHTDTSTTFGGDSSLQSIEYRLRSIIQQAFPTGDADDPSPVFLNQIGIEFEKTGQITFKESKFDKALENNYDGIAHAITGPNGFANQLKTVFESYVRSSDGLLNIKEKGLRARIKEIDDQIDHKTTLLERKKQSVVDQFSRLESTLGNLQRQQQYLSAALPSGGGGGSIVSQLMGG